mgnify:CR=1 FL=1
MATDEEVFSAFSKNAMYILKLEKQVDDCVRLLELSLKNRKEARRQSKINHCVAETCHGTHIWEIKTKKFLEDIKGELGDLLFQIVFYL